MPVEAKPLFRPDVIRLHLSGFEFPAIDANVLNRWASETRSIGVSLACGILAPFMVERDP